MTREKKSDDEAKKKQKKKKWWKNVLLIDFLNSDRGQKVSWATDSPFSLNLFFFAS
jgi:hypothetical protein